MGELGHGFLMLCDKQLEDQAATLTTTIRTTTGLVILKTLESVEEVRGATIDKKLEHMLKVYAHAVIIITSQNFANFIDKRDKSYCPDVLMGKYKDCSSAIKKFIEEEMKKIPNKLILVSVNGDTAVPKALAGMPVLKNEGDYYRFTQKIMARIVAKISQ